MDRALWILHWLSFHSWLRRTLRQMRTIKGLISAGGWVFLIGVMLVPWLFAGRATGIGYTVHIEQVERIGALVILGLCLLTLVTTTGKGAVVVFMPAEVEFLVAGPFSRRGLLTYKFTQLFLGFAIISSFMLILFGVGSIFHLASGPLVGRWLGLFLTMMFLQLLAMNLASVAILVGTSAYNRWRKALLWLILAVAIAAAVQASWNLGGGGWSTLAQLEQTPIARAFLTVPRWFIHTVMIERYWPDFALWGGICWAIDAGLAALLFKLDAMNIEVGAIAGERLYEQLQRIRKGELVTGSSTRAGKPRRSLPTLPWWGGAGPVAWRQLQTLVRSKLFLPLLVLGPIGVMLIGRFMLSNVHQDAEAVLEPMVLGGLLLFMSLVLPSMVTFDFRKDIDRMEILKTLPVSALALVIGQMLTPIVYVTIVQAVATVGFPLLVPGLNSLGMIWGIFLLVVPLNVLIVSLENILFLLAPSRPIPTPGAQLSGLKMVLSVAKFVVFYMICGLAGGLGFLTYVLTGHQIWPAFLAAWVVLAMFAVAMLPVVALAFRRFDVARDQPA